MAQKARKEIADFLSVNKFDRARIRVSFQYASTIAIFLQVPFRVAKKNIPLQNNSEHHNSASIFLFKVNNRNTRKKYVICSNLAIKIPGQCQ